MRAAVCIGGLFGAVIALIVLVTLTKMCETDLRFCPGPVACQVWS